MADSYKAEYCEQATKFCKLGATNAELADFFDVTSECLRQWGIKHPEFKAAIRAGKEVADAEVSDKLYRRATGYSHPDVHISNYQGVITQTEIVKHYAPDTTACIFWLKNRRPDLWRDRHELTGKDGKDLPSSPPDVMEVARSLLYILTSADAQATAAIDKAKERA